MAEGKALVALVEGVMAVVETMAAVAAALDSPRGLLADSTAAAVMEEVVTDGVEWEVSMAVGKPVAAMMAVEAPRVAPLVVYRVMVAVAAACVVEVVEAEGHSPGASEGRLAAVEMVAVAVAWAEVEEVDKEAHEEGAEVGLAVQAAMEVAAEP